MMLGKVHGNVSAPASSADTDLEVATISAAIAAARAAIDQAERALAAMATRAAESHHGKPAVASEPDWGTLDQAAGIRKCTDETMQRHVIANGLGVKAGGRWRVDLNRVRAWQEGKPYTPLEPFPDGEIR